MESQDLNPAITAQKEAQRQFLKNLSGISVTVEEYVETIDLWQRCLVIASHKDCMDTNDEAMFLRRLQVCFLNSHEYGSTPDADVNVQLFCDLYQWHEIIDYTFHIANKVIAVAAELTEPELQKANAWMYSLLEIGLSANSVAGSLQQQAGNNLAA